MSVQARVVTLVLSNGKRITSVIPADAIKEGDKVAKIEMTELWDMPDGYKFGTIDIPEKAE